MPESKPSDWFTISKFNAGRGASTIKGGASQKAVERLAIL